MESILVCKRVDEKVGQDASETAEILSARKQFVCVCERVCVLLKEVPANTVSWGESVLGLNRSAMASWREQDERVQSEALQVFPPTLWFLLCIKFQYVGTACVELLLMRHAKSSFGSYKEEIVNHSR